ncbi:MAG: asparagine synthase-related protein [FCB group bacterium]|jgi:asparagine synthase (glutamine-hydrolysing)|nr:asparagine synthase-related protein [FCB group bacterium]
MHGESGQAFQVTGDNCHVDPLRGTTVAWEGRILLPPGHETGSYLCNCYSEHGVGFAARLRGRFAIALHDPSANEVLLARDAGGTVPLYYANAADGRLVFGSRIEEVLSRTGPASLNPAALIDFLTFFWTLEGETFFRGVQLLPAATVYRGGRLDNFFPFEHRPESRSEDAWCEAIVDTLRTVLREGTVPEAACHLSGGIDSSLMVVMLTALNKRAPQSFVAKFPKYEAYDESPYAQMVAESVGSELNRTVVEPSLFPHALYELLKAIEEPKCHPPVFPRYLLEDAASKKGCVQMVTGRGADELFTGYDSHLRASLDDHRKRRTQFDAELRGRVLRPEFIRAADYEPEAAYDALYDTCRGGTTLERVLALDARTLLANWLVIDYKMGARFGIESVAPFMDRRVMDLALRIPIEVKCPDDRPKALLKRAAEPLLPHEVIHRKKVGFRTPMGEMFREGLEGFVREMLGPGDSSYWDVFEPAGVSALVEEHFAGTRNLGWQLWALLCCRAWFDLYIDGKAARA